MAAELHTQIGRHDAQIEALERDIKNLRADIKEMNQTLHEIHTTLSQARGGWKTLMLVGGAAATISALVTKLVHWSYYLPK
jgi:prefoldin subunit 5